MLSICWTSLLDGRFAAACLIEAEAEDDMVVDAEGECVEEELGLSGVFFGAIDEDLVSYLDLFAKLSSSA